MIVAEQKPLEEMRHVIAPYEKILLLGCGTCVTVCGVGGEREVSLLHSALNIAQTRGGNGPHSILEYTVKRQCDSEFLEVLADEIKEVKAILSLSCGVGVQVLAEHFPDIPILPGVNTSFMGASKELGVWDERCAACGECRLAETGGICPVTRCAKGILNGPCAGSKGGKCEVNKDTDCAWILIYRRLERLGQLERIRRYYPPRNFNRPKKITSKASVNLGGGNG